MIPKQLHKVQRAHIKKFPAHFAGITQKPVNAFAWAGNLVAKAPQPEMSLTVQAHVQSSQSSPVRLAVDLVKLACFCFLLLFLNDEKGVMKPSFFFLARICLKATIKYKNVAARFLGWVGLDKRERSCWVAIAVPTK